MTLALRVSCAGLAALIMMALPAAAKVCKDDSISATSREYISRSLGAFPGSWAAWRKEVKGRLGNGWQAWRRSEDRKVKCQQAENDDGRKRWTCTRTARPCRLGTETAKPSPPVGRDYVPINVVLSYKMKTPRGVTKAELEDQIKTLQHLLNEAGDYGLEEDGDFGRGTRKALLDFQKKNKLDADGRAGPRTLEALTS